MGYDGMKMKAGSDLGGCKQAASGSATENELVLVRFVLKECLLLRWSWGKVFGLRTRVYIGQQKGGVVVNVFQI